MSEMIPLSAGLPAYLQNRKALADLNKDVVTSAQFPTLSIKGKVFTLVRNNEKKLLTKEEDGEQVPVQSVQLSVLRANPKARAFYAGAYVEGESDGQRPTCYSMDGISPSALSEDVQSPKCATCPHSVWGTRMDETGRSREGTACGVQTRLAVVAPDKLDERFLLRVPAGSRKNFADMVKAADARGIPYNALVVKVSFDPLAPAPKLVFKPVGLLPDESYQEVLKLYDSELTLDIVGLGRAEVAKRAETPVSMPAQLTVQPEALRAAAATVQAVDKAKAAGIVTMDEISRAVEPQATIAPVPAASPAPAKPKAEVKPAAPQAQSIDDIMGDLDALLKSTDD